MNSPVKKIASLFKKMVANRNSFGKVWKNIALGREAYERMKELPPTVEGEFSTPEEKAALLGRMLEQMVETQSPRLCIEIREYMRTLAPDDESNNRGLEKLRDYIDLDLPMEEYCRKYRCHLYFDPVERTEAWEAVIGDVEAACSRRLWGRPRRMGFCFMYWSVKREILARYGIEWRTPHEMNPRVIFD